MNRFSGSIRRVVVSPIGEISELNSPFRIAATHFFRDEISLAGLSKDYTSRNTEIQVILSVILSRLPIRLHRILR